MSTATAAVRERPILFSGPMVRALLAGTKTQTRRIIDIDHVETVKLKLDDNGWLRTFVGDVTGARDDEDDAWAMVQSGFERGVQCKFGRPGDRLWVRETHAVHGKHCEGQGTGYVLQWRADNAERELDADTSASPTFDRFPHQRIADEGWKPSIHMPRWACRIVLEITEVRVERLQAISEDDARAEGRSPTPGDPAGYFPETWNAIYGAGAWDTNPWVWALTFKRVMP